jgi:hypothetical protein
MCGVAGSSIGRLSKEDMRAMRELSEGFRRNLRYLKNYGFLDGSRVLWKELYSPVWDAGPGGSTT